MVKIFRQQALGLCLSMPAIILMLTLLICPVFLVMIMSFSDYSLGDASFSWVGIDNYREMMKDSIFHKAIVNTAIYAIIVIPGSLLLGLAAALLIDSLSVGKGFWRAAYFLPVMSTLIAMAVVWEFMMNARFGMVANILRWFGVESQNWLQHPDTALPVLCAIAIWQALGFNMVLFMAGLTAIPKDLYQAAEMDGAKSFWQKFTLITWPLLAPVTLFTSIITAIRSFQIFDTVHVLTKGGPDNASMVLVYQLYQEGFEFFRTSYAAALTVIFLVIIFILTFIKSRIMESNVHY